MKQTLIVLTICTAFLFSCKPNSHDCPPCPDKDTSKITLFDALNKGSEKAGIFTKPIDKEAAKRDIQAFFDDNRLKNPDAKGFIDVKDLSTVLRDIDMNNLSGIRLYTAQYTTNTVDVPNRNYLGKQHLILVLLDKAGNEIYTNLKGNPAVFNYNNDCPYNCPPPPDGNLLMGERQFKYWDTIQRPKIDSTGK